MPSRLIPQCTVMLMDAAAAAGAPPTDPVILRKRVQGLLASALQKLPEEGRLAVQSGKTALVCFVSDPQDGLQAALLLRDEVVQHPQAQLSVRVALHVGAVQVATDANEQLHVTGETIHHAVEILDRTLPNEVVVSQGYHQLLSQLDPVLASRFDPYARGEPTVRLHAASRGGSLAHEARQMDITPDELGIIEHTLERFVAESAQPLMRVAIERCGTAREFIAVVAAGIEHAQQREVFLQALQRALPDRSF